MRSLQWYKRGAAYEDKLKDVMDSVMDFVNISSIYHATQKRQPPHYQTIKD